MTETTTNEKRINHLEKTVIKLQQHIFRLDEARIVDHNMAIDRATKNSGGILDGMF